MIYNTRNLATISTLADNTRKATEKLYDYAKKIGFEILIYEGIRTVAQQQQNVKNGKSKTMKSYHLVGQAFDYVPVDAKGNALWSVGAYVSPKGLQFIKHAKSLGFTWGGDWDNDGDWRDETFLDSPHFQFNYKGYGTDTLPGKTTPQTSTRSYLAKGDSGAKVKEMQENLNKLGYKVTVDGTFGDGTLTVVKQFQKDYKLAVDGYVGAKTLTTLEELVEKLEEDIPVEKYNELVKRIEELEKQKANLQGGKKPGESHEEGWKFLVDNKLSDGSNPGGALTRQQFGTILLRFYNRFLKK